jgi:hypothetical protein
MVKEELNPGGKQLKTVEIQLENGEDTNGTYRYCQSRNSFIKGENNYATY